MPDWHFKCVARGIERQDEQPFIEKEYVRL